MKKKAKPPDTCTMALLPTIAHNLPPTLPTHPPTLLLNCHLRLLMYALLRLCTYAYVTTATMVLLPIFYHQLRYVGRTCSYEHLEVMTLNVFLYCSYALRYYLSPIFLLRMTTRTLCPCVLVLVSPRSRLFQ